MIVIFNSDILYSGRLFTTVPKHLRSFLERCAELGHEIVLPETALLEFNRIQAEARSANIRELEKAYKVLDKYGIQYTKVDPEKSVPVPDLPSLISRLGVRCTVLEPKESELREAHRRACLHEPPHPPDTKSDEMRDLVIWLLSLRVAEKNNGALLISRDEVHTHYRGDEEAKQSGLIRLKDPESVLDYFQMETPSASLIKQLLEKGWDEVVKSAVPLKLHSQIVSIKNCSFKEENDGTTTAYCTISAQSGECQTITAGIKLNFFQDGINDILFKDIKLDGRDYEQGEIQINIQERPAQAINDVKGRHRELKEVLEDY